ncbi:PglL family O-oligosaccharyltransferase [Vibrio tritonius]|uniref:PglL family O-oligosaccharyltransferase n=1 Tax=Vibrio tritonius TaxID=1435069 RepID=A0ABS7YJ81_9VIBR|nr:PglL family O-oligosaccharyltransferase [Vibrio tritonius]MCA2015734.1 PglL family O-oligosaccharyltransferase [Vibrio tritonius]
MAILLLSGTKLEPRAPVVPLNKAFIYAIALLYVYAMHFFMSNPGGSGLALSFNSTTWIAVSIAAGIGLYQLGNNLKLRYSKLTVGLLIACILMTIPVLYRNASLEESALRLIGLWSGWGFFLLLQQFQFSNKERQRLLWLIILATLIEAIFGLYQYFIAPERTDGTLRFLRPYGIFQQPNVMASFMATGFVLAGYMLARQPQKYNRRIIEISLLYIATFVSTLLLVVLASRTGWLALVLTSLLLTPYLYKYAPRRRFISWVAIIILGVSSGISAVQIQGNAGFVVNKADLQSPRRYTFPQTLDMVIEKPFTGYGYGKFESEYLLYTARQHQLNANYHPGLPSMDHPHNELLYWAVEGGLLPIVGIFIAVGFVLLRLYHTKKDTRLALFALIVPISLHTQLEYPFYHSAAHWITFLILLYWIDQRSAKYNYWPFHQWIKAGLRIFSLLIPLLTITFMGSALQTNYVLLRFERLPPHDISLLSKVTNLYVWQDRYNWDVYSTYLGMGLKQHEPKYIQPFIDWTLEIIKRKPRPEFYKNLIIAYQSIGEASRAEQIRSEAKFLFPGMALELDSVQYVDPATKSAASSVASKTP